MPISSDAVARWLDEAEARGLAVELQDDGRLRVSPRDLVQPADLEFLRAEREQLTAALRDERRAADALERAPQSELTGEPEAEVSLVLPQREAIPAWEFWCGPATRAARAKNEPATTSQQVLDRMMGERGLSRRVVCRPVEEEEPNIVSDWNPWKGADDA